MNFFNLINKNNGLIEDGQIKSLPKCSLDNCINLGCVLYGENFVCGECFIKLKNKEIQIQKEMQNKVFKLINGGEIDN
jgi:hypothetical protein